MERRNGRKAKQERDGLAQVRAAGYVRCSTEEQTHGDYNTLESQKDYIVGYIQAVHPEWEIVRFYEDGGYSGKDTNRPGLQALVADCEKAKLDVVVTYKLDRITRSLSDFFDLDRIFQEHSVSFLSVKEQFDTSTAMGRAMRNIALTFAELEREMVAERTKDKMTNMVRQGKWPGGNVPFGYSIENSKLIPREIEAPAIRMMFEAFAETKSLAAVRDKLLAHSIAPRGIKFRDGLKPRISDWNKQKIAYILGNRVYLGELNYDGIRVPDTHEPLISQELFEIARGVIASGVRGRPRLSVDHDYILAGKVFCGHCGCRLTPKSTNHSKRKKPYTPYYECYRLSKYRGIECEVRRINAEVLERLFLSTLDKLSWDEELVAQAAAQQYASSPDDTQLRQKAEEINERLREMDRKIDNILRAVEDGLAGASVQSRLRELESQRTLLQGEGAQIRLALDQSKSEPIGVQEAMDLFHRCSELFQVLTLDEKEKLVDAILKRAKVDGDRSVEFEFYVGEDTADVAQNVKIGSGARIRTWIPGSKGPCPAVGRPRNGVSL